MLLKPETTLATRIPYSALWISPLVSTWLKLSRLEVECQHPSAVPTPWLTVGLAGPVGQNKSPVTGGYITEAWYRGFWPRTALKLSSETPTAIGKVERAQGVMKAMLRRVVADSEATDERDFSICLHETLSTKNSMGRSTDTVRPNGYWAKTQGAQAA